jgi:hypothetical protein
MPPQPQRFHLGAALLQAFYRVVPVSVEERRLPYIRNSSIANYVQKLGGLFAHLPREGYCLGRLSVSPAAKAATPQPNAALHFKKSRRFKFITDSFPVPGFFN